MGTVHFLCPSSFGNLAVLTMPYFSPLAIRLNTVAEIIVDTYLIWEWAPFIYLNIILQF